MVGVYDGGLGEEGGNSGDEGMVEEVDEDRGLGYSVS